MYFLTTVDTRGRGTLKRADFLSVDPFDFKAAAHIFGGARGISHFSTCGAWASLTRFLVFWRADAADKYGTAARGKRKGASKRSSKVGDGRARSCGERQAARSRGPAHASVADPGGRGCREAQRRGIWPRRQWKPLHSNSRQRARPCSSSSRAELSCR